MTKEEIKLEAKKIRKECDEKIRRLLIDNVKESEDIDIDDVLTLTSGEKIKVIKKQYLYSLTSLECNVAYVGIKMKKDGNLYKSMETVTVRKHGVISIERSEKTVRPTK